MEIAQVSRAQLDRLAENLKLLDPGSTSFEQIILNVTKALVEFGTYLFLIALIVAGAIYLFSFGSEETIERARKALLYSFMGFAVFVSVNAGLRYYLLRVEALAGRQPLTLTTITAEVFNTILAASGVGFLVVFVYSGLRYFFTSGNEEAAVNARRGMMYAFIGLIVVASAFAMGEFIIRNIFR